MKHIKIRKTLLAAAGLVAVVLGWAAQGSRPVAYSSSAQTMSADTIKAIDDEASFDLDSTYIAQYDSLEQARLDSLDSSPIIYRIHLTARAYSDHVTLRWAPSGYVPWRYLQDDGFLLEREHIDPERGIVSDTLAILKPLSIDEFKARFAENDTVAAAAVTLLYAPGTTADQTEAYPGSMKSIIERHEEQENRMGFTMLIADMRPDLADAMALRYEDRTARKGTSYTYFLHPMTPDTLLRIYSGHVVNVRLGDYKGEKFNPVIFDSIAPPQTLRLYWSRTPHTTYDIERRPKGTKEWTLLTERPYLPFGNALIADSTVHFYQDSPEPGTYEYRITGYDAFGEKTEPSQVHEAVMPDLIAPLAPYIKRIWLNRTDGAHGTADVVFGYPGGADADEETVGYHIFYSNPSLLGDSLLQLTRTMIATRDTVATISVDNMVTGFLYIAAYDRAGNQALSVPQMIRLEDLIPPHAPTNLRANVAPDGLLILRWTASPDRDLNYYEVYTANDTTHTFMNIAPPDLRDTVFIDSLALGLNQKYIYYKVKAVDWSGNQSEFSELLRVVRPNFAPPSVCRIDSISMTDDAIYMQWVQSSEVDVERSRLFRRLDTEAQWTLLGVYEADSVRQQGNLIRVTDRPEPNMKTRYVYCMETTNASGVSSGMSLPQTFLFTGPRVVDVKLRLQGTFHRDGNQTHLAWDNPQVPDYGPYYFCIYRKGPDDKDFKFLLAAKSTDREFTDYLLRPGETAQYYMHVQWDDGRRSTPSNVVEIEHIEH